MDRRTDRRTDGHSASRGKNCNGVRSNVVHSKSKKHPRSHLTAKYRNHDAKLEACMGVENPMGMRIPREWE